MQTLLDGLTDVPVLVFDAAWQVVSANDLARALVGEFVNASGRERNMAWLYFTGSTSRVLRSEDDQAAADAEIVADLRDALGRYLADEQLATLVDDLRAASPRFAELWRGHPIKRRMASRKAFLHPEVGSITLDCDVLDVQGSDLRLIVYTPAVGPPDADSLTLLGAIGLQSFSGCQRAGRLDLIHHSYHYASTLVSGS